MWLEQVLALGSRGAGDGSGRGSGDGSGGGSTDAFAAGKWQAARYFIRRELPIVDAKFDLLAAGDRTTLDMRNDWF